MATQKIKVGSQHAAVDNWEHELLKEKAWYENNGYARAGNKRGYMHQFIMWAPKGYQIDHINGNKLDNRKENLRVISSKLNKWNQGIRSNNTSGYKGVSWSKNAQKWHAYIKVNYKRIHIGLFDDKEDAAKAYNAAAAEHFGEFARYNNLKK